MIQNDPKTFLSYRVVSQEANKVFLLCYFFMR